MSSERKRSLKGELGRGNTEIDYLEKEERRREEDLWRSVTSFSRGVVAFIYPSVAMRMLALDESDRCLWPLRMISTGSLSEGLETF